MGRKKSSAVLSSVANEIREGVGLEKVYAMGADPGAPCFEGPGRPPENGLLLSVGALCLACEQIKSGRRLR